MQVREITSFPHLVKLQIFCVLLKLFLVIQLQWEEPLVRVYCCALTVLPIYIEVLEDKLQYLPI